MNFKEFDTTPDTLSFVPLFWQFFCFFKLFNAKFYTIFNRMNLFFKINFTKFDWILIKTKRNEKIQNTIDTTNERNGMKSNYWSLETIGQTATAEENEKEKTMEEIPQCASETNWYAFHIIFVHIDGWNGGRPRMGIEFIFTVHRVKEMMRRKNALQPFFIILMWYPCTRCHACVGLCAWNVNGCKIIFVLR